MQAGAIGYIAKGASATALIDAIRSAAEGKPTLSNESLAALIQSPAETEPQPGANLTAREQEVIYLLAQGKTNAQIAETLVVSVAAVKYHVGNILSKLGLANRTEVAAFAREHGLVSNPHHQDKQ
jgi:DNA-binding NarL/FixJ family response regulator